MSIEIKKFDALSNTELYQIMKLRVDVFVVEQNCPYPELDNLDQSAIHFFIPSDNGVNGYLRIYFKSETQVAIGRVITHHDFRKKGISRMLMQQALQWINAQSNIKSIYLQAQQHLVNFYGSFGFEEQSDMYLEDGIPHVDMTLNL